MLLYNEESWRTNAEANFGHPYQQCNIGVMDTIADPDITFNEKGICNYYFDFLKQRDKFVIEGDLAEVKLQTLVQEIKAAGTGLRYDCITGVSGGVDSTYLALQAKKLGLRPLIVHFDNGWNSEIAVKNIENIISKLGFDLYTLVVDWEEFKDIQLAYIKASVIDIEAITDHAIIGTLYKLAAENGIKYILSGTNIMTEAVLPKSWIWNKADHYNIMDIHKKYGTLPLKTFPLFTTRQKQLYRNRGKIITVAPLNYMEYKKDKVISIISDELGWKDYGGKHHESVFTRFYQGYILPVKFGIDKRKAHLSNLIYAGQLTKEKALLELEKAPYDIELLKADYDFVLKKLGLAEKDFEELMLRPRQEHYKFKYEKNGLTEQYPVLKIFKPFKSIISRRSISKPNGA